MRTIEGNSDANGSLDKYEPYMQETYPERRQRLAQELADRASVDVKPLLHSENILKIKRMPGNGSFA